VVLEKRRTVRKLCFRTSVVSAGKLKTLSSPVGSELADSLHYCLGRATFRRLSVFRINLF